MFVHCAEREEHTGELFLCESVEVVALIFCFIDCFEEVILGVTPPFHPCIVSRRNFLAPEFICDLEELSKFDGSIAADTWVWSQPFLIIVEKWIHHLSFEFLFQISDVVWNAECGRNRLCPRRRLRIATFRWEDLGHRWCKGVTPEREAHADELMPMFFEEMGNDTRIDPAGHGEENPHGRIVMEIFPLPP